MASGASGRTERVKPVDLAHQEMTQRPGTALVVLMQELGLELGHVHVRGALALARLALEAEVERLVEGLVVQAVAAGSAPVITRRRALARPRVVCSSSRVTM